MPCPSLYSDLCRITEAVFADRTLGAHPYQQQDEADERDHRNQQPPAGLVDIMQATDAHGETGQEETQRNDGRHEVQRHAGAAAGLHDDVDDH